jgi:hypothetical protein
MPSLDSISHAYALMHRKFPCYAFSIESRPKHVNQVRHYLASFKLHVHDAGGPWWMMERSRQSSRTICLARRENRVPNSSNCSCIDASIVYKNKRLSHPRQSFLHQHPAPRPSNSTNLPAQLSLSATHSLTSTNTIQLAHSHESKHFSTANMVAYTILSVLGLTLTAMATPVPVAEPAALALVSGVTGTVTGLLGSVPALRQS